MSVSNSDLARLGDSSWLYNVHLMLESERQAVYKERKKERKAEHAMVKFNGDPPPPYQPHGNSHDPPPPYFLAIPLTLK